MNEEMGTNTGIIAWPEGADRSAKRLILEQIRRLPASAEQAQILRRALSIEDDSDLTSDLMCAVMRHAGKEMGDDGNHTYGFNDCESIYKDALLSASSAKVRIALHDGLARFHPTSSTDGLTHHDDLLRKMLDTSRDMEEQRALVFILQFRAGYGNERLIQIFNAWIDDEKRRLSAVDIDFWTRALESVKEKWPNDHHTMTAAAARLLRVLSRDQETDVRIRALRFIANHMQEHSFSYNRDMRSAVLEALNDKESQVRLAALRVLEKTEEKGQKEAERILQSDEDTDVLATAWDVFTNNETSSSTALFHLARNPNLDAACQIVMRRALSSKDPSMFRVAWPALPAPFRSVLESRWRNDGEWMERRFHHPMWWDFYHEIFHRHRPNDITTAAAISWVTRPLHEVLGVYDFESITGLRRDDPVEMRTENLLRFGFLADAETHEGVSIHKALMELHQSRFDLNELADLETRFDQERDNVAEIRKELNSLAYHLGDDVLSKIRRWTAEHESPSFEKIKEMFGTAGKRLAILMKEYDHRQKLLSSQESGFGYWRLYHASSYFSEILPKIGCRFDGLVAPDGVLGEYSLIDRSVTLFTPMIDLAAGDISRTHNLPVQDTSSLVRTIVELHELAHAHIHLGRDVSNGIWQEPDKASAAFHESLAQSYTRRIISKMDVPGLNDVLNVMESWLPPEYQFADQLDGVDAEQLRAWFVFRRREPPSRKLDDVMLEVIRALPGYARIIQATLPHDVAVETFHCIIAALHDANHKYSYENPIYYDRLLTTLSKQPNAKKVIGVFVTGGWPSLEEQRWLLHEAQISGPAVGRRPLRFIRKNDLLMAISRSKSAAELGLGPAIRECEDFINIKDNRATDKTTAHEARLSDQDGRMEASI